MENIAFFGEKGLTSTSANHIANLAKEYVKNLQTQLDTIRLYSTTIGLIGSNERSYCSYGIESSSLESIPDMLEKIALATALIAWLREAIKAKSALNTEVVAYDVLQYCKKNNVQYPVMPTMGTPISEEEYYDSLPIKERNRYYQLEAKAATIGKYIHPDGSFGKAREDLMHKINHPIAVDGKGRDTVLYSHEPTVSDKEIDDLFFKLQDEYRNTQAALNSIKFECEKAVQASKEKCVDEYQYLLLEYTTKMKQLQSFVEQYRLHESKRIRDLKIVIPDSLESIYREISQLGNKKKTSK